MKETNVVIKCDLCGNLVSDKTEPINYPVIFTTEQTEGRCVKPYLQYTKLDICTHCEKKVLKITASGAQGNNTYKVK